MRTRLLVLFAALLALCGCTRHDDVGGYTPRQRDVMVNYTAASTVFVAPADVGVVHACGCGGGGGGGFGASGTSAAGGGVGGGSGSGGNPGIYSCMDLAVVPGTSYTVLVGSGGTGGVNSGSIAATPGNDTQWTVTSGGAVQWRWWGGNNGTGATSSTAANPTYATRYGNILSIANIFMGGSGGGGGGAQATAGSVIAITIYLANPAAGTTTSFLASAPTAGTSGASTGGGGGAGGYGGITWPIVFAVGAQPGNGGNGTNGGTAGTGGNGAGFSNTNSCNGGAAGGGGGGANASSAGTPGAGGNGGNGDSGRLSITYRSAY